MPPYLEYSAPIEGLLPLICPVSKSASPHSPPPLLLPDVCRYRVFVLKAAGRLLCVDWNEGLLQEGDGKEEKEMHREKINKT